MTEETKMDVDNEVNNENTSDETQFIGRVNWFDRKKGYGFIKCVSPDNEYTGQDIFFHYSNIKTENFKTLYPGEYVSFNIGENKNDSESRVICLDITGVYGGPLLTDNTNYNIRISEKRNKA